MPQLEISTYIPQLVWLAITFGLLYVVMARIALPRLGETIEQRRDRIATYLDEAETLRQSAEESHQSRRSLLAQSRLEARHIGLMARQDITKQIERERIAVNEEMAKRIGAAEADINAVKAKAMEKVKDLAVQPAREIVEVMVGDCMTQGAVHDAIDTIASRQKPL